MAHASRTLPLLVLWLSGAALAQDAGLSGDAGAPPQPIDETEYEFGATNVNAALGDGHLSVGVARTGEVTVLRWPGPGSPDHLRYLTALQAPDGGSARSLPYFGAGPDMGFFVGLRLGGSVSFLRDAPWQSTQAYSGVGSPVLVTTFSDGAVQVTQSDFVVWQQDVFVRRLAFTGLPGPTRVIVYGALAPCAQLAPLVPYNDWFFDSPATATPVDFALFYSPSDDAFVQFRPEEAQVVALTPAAATAVVAANAGSTQAAAQVASLDATFGPGFYFAWGASIAPSEETGAVMAHSGRSDGGARPAFDDATAGELSGGLAALAPASGALAFDLVPDGGAASLEVFLGAGSSSATALAAVAAARASGAAALRQQTEQGWAGLVGTFMLPMTSDSRALAVATRALMTIVTATDAATGAIVASITTQPPYAEDWPRDSAFIDYTLERAGLSDRAEANALFLASVQRTQDQPGEPAGSFAMNYYPNGQPGGPIPFEIDNTGFALWSFVEHGEWLDSSGAATAATAYRTKIYPAAKLAADLLTSCTDPATGLQCLANEDDNPVQTQTLDGAVAVLLGLDAAARLAAQTGHTADETAWGARAVQLKAAILASFVDGGLLVGERGARAWALWPTGLFDAGDPRIDAEADVLLADLSGCVTGQTAGSSYDGKLTDALAMVLAGDEGRLSQLQPIVTALLDQAPTGTGHYGEVYVTLGHDGGQPIFENRVAMPHVWEGSLNYLSAIFLFGAEGPAAKPTSKGCGCGQPGESFPLALLALFWRRLSKLRSPQGRSM